ncbi:MAG: FKBP-type peptidyl-prolyl cis-trans isomerase [Draconibacterium sp.]
MKIRTIILAFVTFTAFAFTSCLKTNNDVVERTKAIEQEEINDLLAELTTKGFDIDTTDAGVFYIVYEEGEGPVVTYGDSITITYEAFHINGSLLDDSDYWYENGEWEFEYPDNDLIQGFTDGLSIMNKGMVAQFIIPSELAYGAIGYYPAIDAYETIVYGIKMIDIRSNTLSE